MERIGTYCKFAVLAVLLSPVFVHAGYQPVTGSTITANISDDSNNKIHSLSDGSSGYALEVAQVATGFAYSTVNSTSSYTLATNTTWYGTCENIITQTQISLLGYSFASSGIVTVGQFIDSNCGQNISSFTITMPRGSNGFSFSRTINGNYIKIGYCNTGIGISSGAVLNTYYGTIPPTTQLGNSPVGLYEVGGTAVTLGQKTTAASIPVTLPSDILADNGVAAGTNRLSVLPSIYQNSYLNGTAATQGRNGALSQGTDGLLWTASLPSFRPSSYHASTGPYLVSITTGDFTSMCGNASRTVALTGLKISCTQTTSGIVPISINRYSTAYQGAWSTMTSMGDDYTQYAIPNSTVTFTSGVGRTNGTLVSYIDSDQFGCLSTTSTVASDNYKSPDWWRTKPIVLRGVAQCVGANFQGSVMPGAKVTATWEWIETTTITP